MYSLYKQATVGNVTTPRPGIWDMLGRAKWDAWAKHKDLDPYEAKWLYVDALMKVLKKYPEKAIARELVQELESYAGDPSNILMSRTLSRGSQSSGSSDSDANRMSYSASYVPNYQAAVLPRQYQPQSEPLPPNAESTDGDTETDDGRGIPVALSPPELSDRRRPMSSLSGQRYRTPMTSMMLSPPPMNRRAPLQQPPPRFETQSAFNDDISVWNDPTAATTTYPPHLAPSSRSDADGILVQQHLQPHRGAAIASLPDRRQSAPPPSGIMTYRPSIEHAVQDVQANLAALTERLETLELTIQAHRASVSLSPKGSRSPLHASGSSEGRGGRPFIWDLEDMGLWSIVLQPISRVVRGMRHILVFLAVDENRTPTFVVVRRLLLDLSFILCVLAVFKLGWKRTGLRRGEISRALGVLWRAIIGEKKPRRMVDRAI